MKRNAVSLTMAAAMLTGMLGSAPAFAADLSNLPDKVGEGAITATPEMYADTDLSDSYTVNMYLIGYRASAVVIGVYVLVFNVSHAALRRLVAGQSTKPKRRLESSSNKTLAVINVHILV